MNAQSQNVSLTQLEKGITRTTDFSFLLSGGKVTGERWFGRTQPSTLGPGQPVGGLPDFQFCVAVLLAPRPRSSRRGVSFEPWTPRIDINSINFINRCFWRVSVVFGVSFRGFG